MGLNFYIWGTFVLTLGLSSKHVLADDPVVDTTYGKIQGFATKALQDPFVDYLAFEGIPYAKPPTGALRFKASIPADPWTTTLPCLKPGPKCPQINSNNETEGSEDCLTLNIYTKDLTPYTKAAVMVYVHGGDYLTGQGADHSPDYLMDKDIVFVTLNYRLGVLGFLSTMDENANGNAGLKDILTALEWIQFNIENFGGDPGKVTLFGADAGSHAVSLLQLCPRSGGLFQQLISQSSSALSTRHLQLDPVPYVTNLAKNFKVNTDTTKNIVEGLQKVDFKELLKAANTPSITGYVNGYGPLPFFPVIEKKSTESVISDSPYQLLSTGNFNKMPFIFGCNDNEGTYGYEIFKQLDVTPDDYDFKAELWYSKAIRNDAKATEIGRQIREIYVTLNGSAADPEVLQQFFADELFFRANRKELDFLVTYSEGYYYQFAYQGSHRSPGYRGVAHGEELQYLFNVDGDGTGLSENDVTTRKRMITLWTNFAIYGDPTPALDDLLENTEWTRLNNGSEWIRFLTVNVMLSVGMYPGDYRYQFWNETFETYGIPPLVTF